MPTNLSWLFWAYGIGWLLIFGYLVWMSRRQQSLGRRLGQLRDLIEKKSDRR